MRLDKFLKVSRLIKRRTVANQACENNRVTINGKIAKPASKVAVDDIIEITFGDKVSKIQITDISEYVRKQEAKELYKIL
jgi:ribosomal 50S subunit-recycling heat shock protein